MRDYETALINSTPTSQTTHMTPVRSLFLFLPICLNTPRKHPYLTGSFVFKVLSKTHHPGPFLSQGLSYAHSSSITGFLNHGTIPRSEPLPMDHPSIDDLMLSFILGIRLDEKLCAINTSCNSRSNGPFLLCVQCSHRSYVSDQGASSTRCGNPNISTLDTQPWQPFLLRSKRHSPRFYVQHCPS